MTFPQKNIFSYVLIVQKKKSTPTKLGCTLWERTSRTRSLVEAEERITNNKLCKTSIEELPICSHIYSGGMFLKGLFPGTRKGKKRGKTRWRNETTTSPSPPTGAEREPTLRNFTSFTPTPQAIRPSPPRKKRRKKNGPVFEDACRGGLCSGHRITVGVTGLDTSVRCYALTHILTGPF